MRPTWLSYADYQAGKEAWDDLTGDLSETEVHQLDESTGRWLMKQKPEYARAFRDVLLGTAQMPAFYQNQYKSTESAERARMNLIAILQRRLREAISRDWSKPRGFTREHYVLLGLGYEPGYKPPEAQKRYQRAQASKTAQKRLHVHMRQRYNDTGATIGELAELFQRPLETLEEWLGHLRQDGLVELVGERWIAR